MPEHASLAMYMLFASLIVIGLILLFVWTYNIYSLTVRALLSIMLLLVTSQFTWSVNGPISFNANLGFGEVSSPALKIGGANDGLTFAFAFFVVATLVGYTLYLKEKYNREGDPKVLSEISNLRSDLRLAQSDQRSRKMRRGRMNR